VTTRNMYPTPLGSVKFAYDGSIAVDIGDLMYHDTNDAKPASSQADAGSEAANQAAFVPKFAGVAIERKLATDAAGDIDVAVDWIGQMACASSTFEIGDMVTIDEASSGTALEDQKLVKTTDPSLSIGYVIERYASATTTVLCRLLSNVLPPNMLGTGAITPTTVVASTSVTTPIAIFNGLTGANEIRLPANLADALSIEDSTGDLLVFTTTTGAHAIASAAAWTHTGNVTLSGAVDLIFSGTTGQPEIVVPDNVADALSIKDATGGADILVITTTNSAEAVAFNVPIRPKTTIVAVAAAGSTVADAGQLPRGNVCHISSDGAAKGVKLPTGVAGDCMWVINDSATAAELYAASGGTVNGLSADASIVVPASKGVLCFCTAADTWIAYDMNALASAS
jgi:hypothetical protein